MKAKRLLIGMAAGLFLASAIMPATAKGRITAFPYLETDYSVISAFGVMDAKCSLYIKSENGEVVYSIHKLDQSGYFQKVLDLSSLEDGTYNALIRGNGKTLFSCDFYLVDGKILNREDSGEEAKKLSARIFSQNDFLYVSFLNRDLKSVHMRIEDMKGHELFSSSVKDEFNYTGKFDVSALPQGTYYVNLDSGQSQSSYVFKK